MSVSNSMLISSLLGIGIFLILLLVAICVVVYVFQALALFTIAKRRGISCYGLAWVPVANYWIIGKIADGYNKKAAVQSSLVFAPLLLGLGIGAFVGSFIPFVNILAWIASIVLLVFYFMALYKIYLSCMPNNAVVFLVLSIIFTVTVPFFLFACRNHDADVMTQDDPFNEEESKPEAISEPVAQNPEAIAAEPEVAAPENSNLESSEEGGEEDSQNTEE